MLAHAAAVNRPRDDDDVCHSARVGNTTDHPIVRFYRRVRLPLGLVFVAVVVAKNLDALTSGQALPTVAASALIAFFAWLFLRPFPSWQVSSADVLRARNRREIAWWILWTVIATTMVTWFSVANGFSPPSLFYIGIPVLSLLVSVIGYTKADVIAAKAAESQRS